MGGGKGKLFHNRWSEMWDPKYGEGSGHGLSCRINDTSDYLLLCSDSNIYARKKAKVVSKYPNEVIPFAHYSRNAKNQDFPSLGKDGFATDKNDYSHWSDYAGYNKVNIVIGAKQGKYKLFKGKKRYCQYVRISPQCINNDGYYYDDKGYYGNGQKDKVYDLLNGGFVYTMNAVHFTDRVPQGFTLVNI